MHPPSDRRPRAPSPARRWFPLALGLALLGGHDTRGGATPDPARVAAGRELFHREWLPMDPRSHGGDGLGPVYNESSCVACHNLGGPGGAGPAGKNVDLLTLSTSPSLVTSFLEFQETTEQATGKITRTAGGPRNVVVGGSTPDISVTSFVVSLATARTGQPEPGPNLTSTPLLSRLLGTLNGMTQQAGGLAQVFDAHPGFRSASTVTLHRLGTDPAFATWRAGQFPDVMFRAGMGTAQLGVNPTFNPVFANVHRGSIMDLEAGIGFAGIPAAQARALQGLTTPLTITMFDGVAVTRTQRNTTPLFGLGLIDAIPESAILANAARQADTTTAIAGRASRLRDGRVGRFGWKGQTASVADFVLDACATEVGLEVPGRSQGAAPHAPSGGKPGGLDLTADECNALTTFVRSLPRPRQRPSVGPVAGTIAKGRARFAAIGCADCHTPDLGGVEGLYSDLLLHDMGNATAAIGSYGGGSPGGEDPSDPILARRLGPVERGPDPKAPAGARPGEWRTPPLWGVRDSAPYLHDGRAETLEQAIAAHGGQGADSSRRFFEAEQADRIEVEAFLRSLVAPANPDPLAMR